MRDILWGAFGFAISAINRPVPLTVNESRVFTFMEIINEGVGIPGKIYRRRQNIVQSNAITPAPALRATPRHRRTRSRVRALASRSGSPVAAFRRRRD